MGSHVVQAILKLTEDDLTVLSFMQTGDPNQAFLPAGQALSLQSLISSPVFFSSLLGSSGQWHQTALVILYGQIIGEQSENKILCPSNVLGMALLTILCAKGRRGHETLLLQAA